MSQNTELAPPLPFKTWLDVYSYILKNKPNILTSSEVIIIQTASLHGPGEIRITTNELKAKCFDELSQHFFTADELHILTCSLEQIARVKDCKRSILDKLIRLTILG